MGVQFFSGGRRGASTQYLSEFKYIIKDAVRAGGFCVRSDDGAYGFVFAAAAHFAPQQSKKTRHFCARAQRARSLVLLIRGGGVFCECVCVCQNKLPPRSRRKQRN